MQISSSTDIILVLKLPEIILQIFRYCIRPAVFFRYNLVCKAWNKVVEEENFFKEHAKEWSPLKRRIDLSFMWTEYYSIYDPIMYEYYLDFKRRLRILSDDQIDGHAHVELISDREVFTFRMNYSSENIFEIETRSDNNDTIISDGNKGKILRVVATKTTYYHSIAETDVDEVDVVNIKSLKEFKENHFPNVPPDGFYSILESLVYGKYSDSRSHLLEWGVENFYNTIEKSKGLVLKSYREDQDPEDSLLSRTLVLKNQNLTQKLMNKGHLLSMEQVEYLATHIRYADTFKAEFTCKYLKKYNFDLKTFQPDVESILNSPPEVCRILIEEEMVTCPDTLIDVVDGSTHVNYPTIDYLKTVNPKLKCPLDTRSIKKTRSPKLIVFFENQAHLNDQEYLYTSMHRSNKVFCDFLPQNLTSNKSKNKITESVHGKRVILFRPRTFTKSNIEESLTFLKGLTHPNQTVCMVCFYTSLADNKALIRDIFSTLKGVYLMVEFDPYPCSTLIEETFEI